MADFQAHITQAKKNLAILSEINLKISNSWDWQVTCAYYCAVHIMNARLAKTFNLHYKTHVDVKKALYNSASPCKISDDVYTAYAILENYSRRARYLCHEQAGQTDGTIAYLTFDKHLKKTLKNLDLILVYFASKYGIAFIKVSIDCIEIKNLSLSYFVYKQSGLYSNS
jgi:hypothetical protein